MDPIFCPTEQLLANNSHNTNKPVVVVYFLLFIECEDK
jgi:hypothetical protein